MTTIVPTYVASRLLALDPELGCRAAKLYQTGVDWPTVTIHFRGSADVAERLRSLDVEIARAVRRAIRNGQLRAVY